MAGRRDSSWLWSSLDLSGYLFHDPADACDGVALGIARSALEVGVVGLVPLALNPPAPHRVPPVLVAARALHVLRQGLHPVRHLARVHEHPDPRLRPGLDLHIRRTGDQRAQLVAALTHPQAAVDAQAGAGILRWDRHHRLTQRRDELAGLDTQFLAQPPLQLLAVRGLAQDPIQLGDLPVVDPDLEPGHQAVARVSAPLAGQLTLTFTRSPVPPSIGLYAVTMTLPE